MCSIATKTDIIPESCVLSLSCFSAPQGTCSAVAKLETTCPSHRFSIMDYYIWVNLGNMLQIAVTVSILTLMSASWPCAKHGLISLNCYVTWFQRQRGEFRNATRPHRLYILTLIPTGNLAPVKSQLIFWNNPRNLNQKLCFVCPNASG